MGHALGDVQKACTLALPLETFVAFITQVFGPDALGNRWNAHRMPQEICCSKGNSTTSEGVMEMW